LDDKFVVDPAALRAAASQLREHASEVEAHGHMLSASTEGAVGRGPIGEVVESAVKRGIQVVTHGIAGAVRRFHEDTALGLERMAKRTEDADGRVKTTFDDLARGPHAATDPICEASRSTRAPRRSPRTARECWKPERSEGWTAPPRRFGRERSEWSCIPSTNG
jgi:hypothetical protein